ncbi:DUF4402 domain-containing protein [Photobacterium angustum]|uniref:DUF4402 domain-containing protein n=1 Tax=Photobacterium angustum TaxID=661 RepID=A0A2S7VJH6_PHOAN|nr:DUF4402 domain-containing protein [Photobacterium angustum]PQJ62293.1 hypothetical protein BTO08_18815 [Photobacterium angustum]
MKKIIRAVTFVTFASLPLLSHAEDQNIQATIEVIAPLTLVQTSALDFGTIFSDSTTNVVVATTDAGAAAFNITGHDGDSVNITHDNTATMTHSTTSDTISVTGITTDLTTALLSTSPTEVKVGGTADIVNASSPLVVGTYTGTFNVSVVYQ